MPLQLEESVHLGPSDPSLLHGFLASAMTVRFMLLAAATMKSQAETPSLLAPGPHFRLKMSWVRSPCWLGMKKSS